MENSHNNPAGTVLESPTWSSSGQIPPPGHAASSHHLSLIPEFDLLLKELEDVQSKARERPTDRGAFLTASSGPQHPGDKRHSC